MKRFGLARAITVATYFFVDATTASAQGHATLSNASVFPEPGTMVLLGAGLLLVARRLRKPS